MIMIVCVLQALQWEQLAVLSDEQQAAVDLISQHCSERPVPAHVRTAACMLRHLTALAAAANLPP